MNSQTKQDNHGIKGPWHVSELEKENKYSKLTLLTFNQFLFSGSFKLHAPSL